MHVYVLTKNPFSHKFSRFFAWQPPLVLIFRSTSVGCIYFCRLCYPGLRNYLPVLPFSFIKIQSPDFRKVSCSCVDATKGFLQAIFLSIQTPRSVKLHSQGLP